MGAGIEWRYVSHLYSSLDTSTVVNEYELPLNEDGSHVLPEILKKYQFSRPR